MKCFFKKIAEFLTMSKTDYDITTEALDKKKNPSLTFKNQSIEKKRLDTDNE